MLTPKEVISAMAADFRKRNLSYTDVANLTGYKMQTVANMVCSRKEYLTIGQAARYCAAFGYNMEFLTSGKGRLCPEDDMIDSLEEGEVVNDDSRKLVALMGMLNRYLFIVHDPALMTLYRNMLNLINEKDSSRAYEHIRNQEKLFDMIAAANGVHAPDAQKSKHKEY